MYIIIHPFVLSEKRLGLSACTSFKPCECLTICIVVVVVWIELHRYESELLFPVRINKIILDSVSKTTTVSQKRCLEEYYLSKWNPFISCVVFGNQIWLQLTTPSFRWKQILNPKMIFDTPAFAKRHGCSHLYLKNPK